MIKELIEKRQRLHEENVALMKHAKDDGRDVLTADEEQEWQSRDTAIEALSKQIERYNRQAEVEKFLAEPETRRVQHGEMPEEGARRTSASVVARAQRGQADLEMALRGWFLNGRTEFREDHRSAAQRVGWDLNSKFLNFNLNPRAPKTVAEARALERRDLTVTTTAGGYTIPDEMMRAFEAAMLFFGGMRQAATIIRTETGADLPFPMANDTGNTGEILGINTGANEQDVAFTQLVLKAFKYSSKMIQVPVELMQDNAINLPAVLGEMLGERIGRIQNTHFTTGAGTTVPWGIVTRATAGATTTGSVAAGLTYANLVDQEHSVDIAYRRMGASWMMSDVLVSRFKKLTDSATGRPLWQPTLTASIGNPAQTELLGYPVIVNNDVASAQTNGTRVAVFGALQKYLIRDVTGITLLRLDERYAEAHQVAFLAFARADGDLANAGTNPVKYLQYTT